MIHTYLISRASSEEQSLISELLSNRDSIDFVEFSAEGTHMSVSMTAFHNSDLLEKLIVPSCGDFTILRQLDVTNRTVFEEDVTKRHTRVSSLVLAALMLAVLLGFNSYFDYSTWDFVRVATGFAIVFFGSAKLRDLLMFAEAHQRYDLISKHFAIYAYMYPFIEMLLGVLVIVNPTWMTYYFVTVVFLLRALGMLYTVAFNDEIQHVSYQGLFEIPISTMTVMINFVLVVFGFVGLALTFNAL